MPRKPTQARSKQTYQSILEAGFISVAKDGIDGTTTRRIADIAGIGVASIYEYFRNKNEIYEAMSAHLADAMANQIKTLTPRVVRLSLQECVYELVLNLAKILRENDERYLKCLQESLFLEQSQQLGKVYRALKDLFTEHTFKHPEHLQIRDLPVVAYVLINSGVFTTIRFLSQPNPPFTLEEFATGLSRMGGHYVSAELGKPSDSNDIATQ